MGGSKDQPELYLRLYKEQVEATRSQREMKNHLIEAADALLEKLYYHLSSEDRKDFRAEIEELASAVHKTRGF